MEYVALFILIGIPILAIIGGVVSIGNDLYGYFFRRVEYQVRVAPPPSNQLLRTLEKYSAYYKVLPEKEKKLFARKVQRFKAAKRFFPRKMKKVTEEMKVLISASAVQLTFGLPNVYLSHFDKILVYPDSYYSNITKHHHMGEVNPRMGIIILSWRDFVRGYGDLQDSYNVGVHEMAHAIHFENEIRNEEFGFLDEHALLMFDHIADREMPKIAKGNHFLRKYASTNHHEFFAVSLEYFFEKPIAFKKEIPDLYETLCRLLGQDPIKLYKLDVDLS